MEWNQINVEVQGRPPVTTNAQKPTQDKPMQMGPTYNGEALQNIYLVKTYSELIITAKNIE